MRTDRICALALAGALALGCEEPEPLPVAPQRDGSIDRDGSLVLPPGPGPRDAGPGDGGDVVRLDGGDGAVVIAPPVIDGTIGETEWLGAAEALAVTPPSTAFPADSLARLLVVRTASRLYIAVEGTIALDRFFVMLLDASYEDERGVDLSSGTGLDDISGALDRAISTAAFRSGDVGFRPDYAWGASEIPFVLDGSAEGAGWRDITRSPNDFVSIDAGNRTVCSETACETSIVLGPAGIAGAGTIALAVRTTNGFGALSNQTLPPDDPIAAESIETVLLVSPPAP